MRWLKAAIARFRMAMVGAMPTQPVGLARRAHMQRIGSSNTASDINLRHQLQPANQVQQQNSVHVLSTIQAQRLGEKIQRAQQLHLIRLKVVGLRFQILVLPCLQLVSQVRKLGKTLVWKTKAEAKHIQDRALVQTRMVSPYGVRGVLCAMPVHGIHHHVR